ncbi:kinetochore-associated Ndc80 complex subunit nuf2 [Collariella sp. IMI 366227]|nr:kinetochore-associated Ndc80 complex subunit nuf2 [Collariella sp. IMI 366227]
MAYSSRMSMMPNAQQQSRQRKKEEEALPGMRLTDNELYGCINELGIPMTLADLQKPNPIQVQMIFERFAELLMNKTRTTVDPAMRAAAEDLCGGFGDSLMPPDTRNLMGFFVSLRRLMLHCGINDFSFTDLYRPTADRLNKILSYLINFVRFRESQLAMEALAAEKTQRNEELKRRLLELKKNQEKIGQRMEDARTLKSELAAELEEKTTTKLALKQESAKLRPYTLQSPSALQSRLTELSTTLSTDKSHNDSLDRRARALQTSTDSFTVVCADVASCIKLLEEIAVELSKEEEDNAKNAKQRDALTERGASVREVERTEALLQRQLSKWTERTEALRAQSQEKARRAQERMEELRGDIERRRVRIEQIEKKMLDLKENIENEVHAAHDEYLKLEAHIKLYITEMEQAI